MTTNDPLELLVFPAHQQLASRLGLASIDNDEDRYRQCLAEIQAGGMDCAIAVITVLTNHPASGMAISIGVGKARALLEAAILKAGQAGADGADGGQPDRPLKGPP